MSSPEQRSQDSGKTMLPVWIVIVLILQLRSFAITQQPLVPLQQQHYYTDRTVNPGYINTSSISAANICQIRCRYTHRHNKTWHALSFHSSTTCRPTYFRGPALSLKFSLKRRTAIDYSNDWGFCLANWLASIGCLPTYIDNAHIPSKCFHYWFLKW